MVRQYDLGARAKCCERLRNGVEGGGAGRDYLKNNQVNLRGRCFPGVGLVRQFEFVQGSGWRIYGFQCSQVFRYRFSSPSQLTSSGVSLQDLNDIRKELIRKPQRWRSSPSIIFGQSTTVENQVPGEFKTSKDREIICRRSNVVQQAFDLCRSWPFRIGLY